MTPKGSARIDPAGCRLHTASSNSVLNQALTRIEDNPVYQIKAIVRGEKIKKGASSAKELSASIVKCRPNQA